MVRHKVSLWVWIHNISNILSAIIAQSNTIYRFNNCDIPRDNLYKDVVGAVVESQAAQTYVNMINVNCTYIFMTPKGHQNFLLQFDTLDIKKGEQNTCPDYLTIKDYNTSDQPPNYVLNKFCGTATDLSEKDRKLVTYGKYLSINWVTGSDPSNNKGFKLVLTALKSGTCNTKTHIQCSNNDCISLGLRCDGINHCYNGEDEAPCPGQQPTTDSSVPLIPGLPTKDPSLTTQPFESPSTEEVYLWLPLIVVILFTGVMVTLILIGRKSDVNQRNNVESTEHTTTPKRTTSTTEPHDPQQGFTRTEVIYMALMAGVFLFIVVVCLVIGKRSRAGEEISNFSGTTSEGIGLTDERNELRIDVNGNPNYEPEPGMPSTPPPSYSVIERQTSYVSHISVSSSQMSEPPDYSDAIELPGEPGVSRTRSSRRNNRRPTSRRNSGGSSSSRFARLRNRIFSRSMSATEPRQRYRSSASSGSDTEQDPSRISEVSDVVFVDEASNNRNSRQTSTTTSPAIDTQPVDHSTPDPVSSSAAAVNNKNNTTSFTNSNNRSGSLKKNSNSAPGAILSGAPAAAPTGVSRSDSQTTAVTSITSSGSDDSGNERVSATNIFAQIHSLNLHESDNELDVDNTGDRSRIEHDESSVETTGSDGGNVSEMALLSHAEPPDVSTGRSSSGGAGGGAGGGNSALFY